MGGKICSIYLIGLIWLISPVRVLAISGTYDIGSPDASKFSGVFQGFGAEWDPFFWNTNNQNRGLVQTDWALITSRIKQLSPGIIRMMMQLNWATSDQNLVNWTWNTAQMQSVFKYLDFICANNIHVVLTDWGWAVRGDLYNDPADIRFARGVATYVNEFINNRGYSCIKYLVIGNEPDNEIQREFGQAKYEQMYQNVYNELNARGLLSKVKLTGPDMGGQWDFMKTSISNMKGILQAYDFHRYASLEEVAHVNLPGDWETLWSHLDLWRSEVNSRDPNGAGKLILITEMGMSGGGTNESPMIDTYDYALHMADYGTTTLATRINGGIVWTMHDIYYFDGGQFMKWGMWRYKDQNWSLRPWSQTFGLLMKFAPRGSIGAPINGTPPAGQNYQTQYRGAALKRPDGGWSLFLVNRMTAPVDLTINLATPPMNNFDRYIITEQTITSYPDDLIIPPAGTVARANSLNIQLPPRSFTVLAEKTAVSRVDIESLRQLLSLFTGIFDYTNLISLFGK
jgi:hypothetical protein